MIILKCLFLGFFVVCMWVLIILRGCSRVVFNMFVFLFVINDVRFFWGFFILVILCGVGVVLVVFEFVLLGMVYFFF